jgi:hypothetical protein
MRYGADFISELVDAELSKIADSTLEQRIRELLVPPYPVEREWDYGPPDQHFTCWTVIEHRPSNTGVAFCAEGFGPSDPWGLIFLSGPRMDIGMDCSWYASLEDAVRNSIAWGVPNSADYEVQ